MSTAAEGGADHFVLYVEDEEILREAGLAALTKAGFAALGAANGGEALRHFRAAPQRFPVVVLDWNMPGVSGVELIRELRALHPEVRILLATAEDAGALPDLRASGAWLRALRKPFRSYELLSQVAALLAQR
ncbi:MAG: response regulator [Planctomycetes bacterium]|nr:response regulator [Planctomycetota bacterium]